MNSLKVTKLVNISQDLNASLCDYKAESSATIPRCLLALGSGKWWGNASLKVNSSHSHDSTNSALLVRATLSHHLHFLCLSFPIAEVELKWSEMKRGVNIFSHLKCWRMDCLSSINTCSFPLWEEAVVWPLPLQDITTGIGSLESVLDRTWLAKTRVLKKKLVFD